MLADKIGSWTEIDAREFCAWHYAEALEAGRTDDACKLHRCLVADKPLQALAEMWDAAYADKMSASMRAMWDDDRDAPR
jgi:hypothetical protein